MLNKLNNNAERNNSTICFLRHQTLVDPILGNSEYIGSTCRLARGHSGECDC